MDNAVAMAMCTVCFIIIFFYGGKTNVNDVAEQEVKLVLLIVSTLSWSVFLISYAAKPYNHEWWS